MAEGLRDAMEKEEVRCRQVEIVLDELAAVRHAMARSNPGDLVVLCVDQHPKVLAELEGLTSSAQAGAHPAEGDQAGDPDLNAGELQTEAQASGDEAGAEASVTAEPRD